MRRFKELSISPSTNRFRWSSPPTWSSEKNVFNDTKDTKVGLQASNGEQQRRSTIWMLKVKIRWGWKEGTSGRYCKSLALKNTKKKKKGKWSRSGLARFGSEDLAPTTGAKRIVLISLFEIRFQYHTLSNSMSCLTDIAFADLAVFDLRRSNSLLF